LNEAGRAGLAHPASGVPKLTIKIKQFTQVPNAGDTASSLIASYVAGDSVSIIGEDPCDEPNLIALGSILHWADANSLVWGTGFISDSIGLRVAPKAIASVRGHLTREHLEKQGIRCPPAVGDPGVFIPDLFPPSVRTIPLGVVPHYVDANEAFVRSARDSGAEILDVLSPIKDYLGKLSSCQRIISSSLHGLVFAHAYGIPAVWVKLSPNVIGDGFKFLDYYSSIGVSRGRVPIFGPTDPIATIADYCEPPPKPIDKRGLVDALRPWLPALSVRPAPGQSAAGGMSS
jgi:pyruvyltransferase